MSLPHDILINFKIYFHFRFQLTLAQWAIRSQVKSGLIISFFSIIKCSKRTWVGFGKLKNDQFTYGFFSTHIRKFNSLWTINLGAIICNSKTIFISFKTYQVIQKTLQIIFILFFVVFLRPSYEGNVTEDAKPGTPVLQVAANDPDGKDDKLR